MKVKFIYLSNNISPPQKKKRDVQNLTADMSLFYKHFNSQFFHLFGIN